MRVIKLSLLIVGIQNLVKKDLLWKQEPVTTKIGVVAIPHSNNNITMITIYYNIYIYIHHVYIYIYIYMWFYIYIYI